MHAARLSWAARPLVTRRKSLAAFAGRGERAAPPPSSLSSPVSSSARLPSSARARARGNAACVELCGASRASASPLERLLQLRVVAPRLAEQRFSHSRRELDASRSVGRATKGQDESLSWLGLVERRRSRRASGAPSGQASSTRSPLSPRRSYLSCDTVLCASGMGVHASSRAAVGPLRRAVAEQGDSRQAQRLPRALLRLPHSLMFALRSGRKRKAEAGGVGGGLARRERLARTSALEGSSRSAARQEKQRQR